MESHISREAPELLREGGVGELKDCDVKVANESALWHS